MLKKLIKSGRWKLLSMVFTAITLIAVATTVTLELTGSFIPGENRADFASSPVCTPG